MNTSRFDLYRLLSLLALLAAAGCSCGGWEVDEQSTPWIRLESRSPYVDLPHAVEIGKHAERVSVLREGRWKPFPEEGRSPQAQPFDGGRRALVGILRESRRWFVLHQEEEAFVTLPEVCERGPLRTLADDELVCVACLRVPGVPGCTEFEVARFDVTGSRVSGDRLRLPPEYEGCEISNWSTIGLVGERAAFGVSLYCKGRIPALPGRQLGCVVLAVEPGRLRTVLDLDEAEPCCANSEWAQCMSASHQYTRRYF